MFEGKLAELLDSLFADYVKSYDKEKLNLAVWAGEVSYVITAIIDRVSFTPPHYPVDR